MKSKLIEKLPETFIIFDTEFMLEGSMERNCQVKMNIES